MRRGVKPDVRATDADETPLMVAYRRGQLGHIRVAAALVAAGANLTLVNVSRAKSGQRQSREVTCGCLSSSGAYRHRELVLERGFRDEALTYVLIRIPTVDGVFVIRFASFFRRHTSTASKIRSTSMFLTENEKTMARVIASRGELA